MFENVLIIRHDIPMRYTDMIVLEKMIKEGIANEIGLSVEEVRFKEEIGWSKISFIYNCDYNKTTSFSVSSNEVLVTGELAWETVNVYNIIRKIINELSWMKNNE